ncbi:hypothetical protein RO3G_16755 [Rhizopus delemar RA 99-880]|uniref:Uncharacterized protein n=1 Tax=Rhizopus delemar (strain RA 99-880 / ATCC MYA-4621 / FGSC 9543 / NRRL 43880) TaxID=246409 RepID=I1CUB4_RHIO9|nr:hypothetical protein RO3G_16755 [Rhizopus delemar RA 99-880]|eukprot:EIE92044.1 hypothetical protein RO3G_16755 [Rhizopus delemar RA 99-880]
MTIDVHMEDLSLSLEDFNNPGEQVAEIHTSLVSIMRGTMNDEADNEQNTPKKNEIIMIITKIQDFIKSFANHTLTSKLSILSLVIKVVPVNDATPRKMRDENQEVSENNKRNCAKKDVLKVKRPLFIVKLADNFALMTSEQMKENLIEKSLKKKRKCQDKKYDYETKVAESKGKKKQLESKKQECEYHNKTMDEVMVEKLRNGFERCSRKAHLSSVIRSQFQVAFIEDVPRIPLFIRNLLFRAQLIVNFSLVNIYIWLGNFSCVIFVVMTRLYSNAAG